MLHRSGNRRASISRRGTQARTTLSTAILGALLLGAAVPAAQAQSYTEAGKSGDAASWRSDEFKADWGLGAIGAEYAYARGLSGKGVRVGVFDSGSDLSHPDFAGKDNRSFRIADILDDGSACTNSVGLTDSACFMSDGDQPGVEYFHYTDADREFVKYLVEIGYLYDWVPEYLESIAGFQYNTHGTHVAGTMAANRDGSGSHGVAFGADIATARLFSNSYGDLNNLLGFEGGESYAIGPSPEAVASMYAQMQAAGVRAINHSWGLSQEPQTVEDMDALYASEGAAEYFKTYVDPSLKNGTLQVFAAGNDQPIAGIYASLPRYVPELEKYWLSVVNMNKDGVLDDSSAICGQSKDWCVTAPGTDITSTVVGGQIDGNVVRDADGNFVGLEITDEQREHGYGDMTGTSMAAPHVTGALALLMERFPYLDNPQIRDVLLTTATDMGDAGVDEVYGWGLINLQKAIDGPGQFRVDTDVVMNQRAGGAKVWEGLAWDDWKNDIGGPGRLTKSGAGWLRLSGDNSFAGATVKDGVLELDGDNALAADVRVDGGFFVLNGGLRDTALTVNGGSAQIQGTISGGLTTVAAGGRLGGTGTLGDTVVAGTIAPGNSIGTLAVNGSYLQQTGSFYDAELGADGAADLLQVSGAASLQGGTVRAIRTPGQYRLGGSYTILSAAGGVDGQFAGLDASQFSPFLKLQLVYAGNDVSIDVSRGQSLASAGTTRNQRAAGAGVDSLADANPILQPLVQLFPAQAVDALDRLSGEIHASVQSALIEDDRHVRDTALERARNGHDAFTAQRDEDSRFGAWVDVQRHGGHVAGDGNAAKLDYSGNSTLVGVDYQFENGWRIGALGGAGRNDLDGKARGAKGEVDTRRLGLYGGQSWGGFGLRAGVTYAWHDVEIERGIAFEGFSDRTRADYDAKTRQAFLEGGYRFAAGAWEFEPYLQYAQLRTDSDGFREDGGPAALRGRAEDGKVDLGTAGLRFNVNLRGTGQEQSWLSLRGGLGYRRANGDRTPRAEVAFADGAVFGVEGAPIARKATIAELGVGARLSRNSLLEVGYSGQFGDDGHDHGANARFSVQF
ncbi:autotransporter domain-containing protein [Luteimonas aquatica]|uniref:autotransporter domain-containing protein n=1 Tax=Luteimonas aquatica TaxID=450364 RepID=UPI001F5A33FC|nr:autotransporter domain-containing protein [Luteimonas aquatica]